MTLSDARVRRQLGKQFVCARLDTDGDAAAGESYAHGPRDAAPSCIRGNGEHNLQLLMLDGEGRMVNAVAGFIEPDDLLEELRFALDTMEALEKMPESQRSEALVERQKERAASLREREFEGFMGDWERRRAVADHRFVERNPYLTHDAFRIEAMVGSAKTFFGSSSGGIPEKRLGPPTRKTKKQKDPTGSGQRP